MAVYINQPTLAANFLAPVRTSYDVTGSSIDGGRNGVGEGQTIRDERWWHRHRRL